MTLEPGLTLAGPGFNLDLDALGRPKNGANFIAANATFTITGGSAARTVVVAPVTGFVTRAMRSRHGFSLIELVIVIVVVAIAAVAIGSAFTYISRSQRLTVDLLAATQIAQECAAHVIGRNRKPGSYATVPLAAPSTSCDALPAIDPAFTRLVNVTAMAAGTLCSAGWACKRSKSGSPAPAATWWCSTSCW